jgi:error-prone DNA polymerase
LQALGCWELPVLHDAWRAGGIDAVWAQMEAPAEVSEAAVQGMAASRSTRPVMTAVPGDQGVGGQGVGGEGVGGAVHVYATGFRASPYADVRPAGAGPGTARGPAAPRRLWHASPGSAGG